MRHVESFEAADDGGAVVTIHGSTNPTADVFESQVGEAVDYLREFQAKGVTVIVGCTYEKTARAILRALEMIDYAPLAFSASVSANEPRWDADINAGWWQGRIVIGTTPWAKSRPTRGAFTGFTSPEFVARFQHKYSYEPAYQAIAPVGAVAVLCMAIEHANALETSSIQQTLEALGAPSLIPIAPVAAATRAPHHRSPHHRSPHHRSPHHRSPHHRSPHHRSPHHRSPHHRSPNPLPHRRGGRILCRHQLLEREPPE